MSKRKSIVSPGFKHMNPIPNASRIGNIVVSSVISGMTPGTRSMPGDLASQLVNIFAHVREMVTAAGGTPEDIIKMTFWMRDPASGREAINKEWVRMFPDEAARPARHTQALGSESSALVTADFMAVLSK